MLNEFQRFPFPSLVLHFRARLSISNFSVLIVSNLIISIPAAPKLVWTPRRNLINIPPDPSPDLPDPNLEVAHMVRS